MKKKPGKFSKTQHDLTAALHALRLVVREVGQNYIAGLQAQAVRLEEAVRQSREAESPDPKQLQQMTLMLKWLAELDVKPSKGRRRDLKQLDRVITNLNGIVENW